MVYVCPMCIDEKYNLDSSQEIGQEVGQEVAALDTEVNLTSGADNEVIQESKAGRIDGETGRIDEEVENMCRNNEGANEADQESGTANNAGQINEEVHQIDGEIEYVSTNNEFENMRTNNKVENVSKDNEVENVRRNKKRNPPTTVRNSGLYEKKNKRGSCRKSAQVKLRKENLFHILKSDNQKEYIKKYRNSRNFYGKIVSGNGKDGYCIKFDDLSADDQVVYACGTNVITVVNEGEEEVDCDHSNTNIDVMEGSEKKGGTQKVSINKFCVMKNDDVMSAKTFVLEYTTEDKIT